MSTPPDGPGSARAVREARGTRPIASGLRLPLAHSGLIDQSHARCAALGLSRIERPDYDPLGPADLNVARERNRRLYTHAAPVMELLFDQISGSESMVVLCDATGTIIHSIGDDDFLAKASKVALKPGVNWAEQSKGTNAIGTALIDELPTLVHADEHYMHANHFLTCSAAPILDPRGNILGVLDVTGDHRSYHQHTMGLVKMSARMIENHWLSDDYRHAMRLHFHARGEFIGTLMEGIVALAPDGRVVAANRSALEQLGLSGASLRAQTVVSLFSTTVQALADHFRSPVATPMMVPTPQGMMVHLVGRLDWAAMSAGGWSTAAAAGAPPAQEDQRILPRPEASGSPPAALPFPIGLKQLRTGDPKVETLLGKVQRVINRDIPLLILGETGTGKELLARAVHQESDRGRRPFVAVNCAAIPQTLIEAELLGYADGAFAGARRKGVVGKILQADGGTLFLDEIGDLPPSLQAHLLRVLQERRVVPLGSTTSVPVDVTIICATHRDLRAMMAAKAFREDLYYRLNGMAVKLPPLRERSDLQTLVRRILTDEPGCALMKVSDEVMDLFKACTWPGNVRQLRNVLRTAAVMAGDERSIRTAHLPDDFLEEARAHGLVAGRGASATGAVDHGPHAGSAQMPGTPRRPAEFDASASRPGAALQAAATAQARTVSDASSAGVGRTDAPSTLEALELEAMRNALEAAGGNISDAAKRLGISRNTIYRKLRWRQRDSA